MSPIVAYRLKAFSPWSLGCPSRVRLPGSTSEVPQSCSATCGLTGPVWLLQCRRPGWPMTWWSCVPTPHWRSPCAGWRMPSSTARRRWRRTGRSCSVRPSVSSRPCHPSMLPSIMRWSHRDGPVTQIYSCVHSTCFSINLFLSTTQGPFLSCAVIHSAVCHIL